MNITKLIIAIVLLASSNSSYSADYYVSPTGDDDNSGTSQAQAWHTTQRVNQASNSFGPGDNVYFERGGTFRGKIIIQQSGNPGSPISIGSYGSGPKPIISGSLPISNWTIHSGNIWQATFSDPVKHLYSNGDLQTLARYPNSGWLRNDNGSGTHIYDAALNQSNGYWTGAQAVIRSTMWSYDVADINSYNNSSLNFDNIYYNLQNYEWGYFLQNKYEELDQAGEWFYDNSAQTIYFWAPNNTDPNSLTIEAGTEELGVEVYWTRHDVKLENLHFKHQTGAGVRIDGGSDVEIDNCRFTDIFKALSSYGDNDTFTNNIVERTYGTAVHIIDDNTTISNNDFTDIAIFPGLGESNWGYFGIKSDGDGNVISNNNLINIGYIGIDAKKDALIEKNFIQNSMDILNDGGGIAFDNADGMIIRKNIVVDLEGDLESAAPDFGNYHPITHGIYFGNSSIKNTIVEENTVANCLGSGMHVDHTMLSTNNQILNNVLYNNNTQINFSDFSNYNGAGAQSPYYISNYNNVVSGNVFYSLTEDQMCMNQIMVHTAAHTDFGNFSNNFYFNPYNEQCITITDNHAGNFKYRYTLVRWQNDNGEDLNSSTSPLHLNKYEVTSVNSSNLATNGEFDYNVNDWNAWPNEGLLTHDFSYLDNGALKVHFDDNSTYDYLNTQNDPNVSVEDNEFYQVKFSLQSNIIGELRVGFKANSQPWSTELVHQQYIPFSSQRREIEYFFQSDITDNGKNHFFNDWDESTYWVDNVEMYKVSVLELDPTEKSVLFINEQPSTQTMPLTGCYSDVSGNIIYDEIILPAFSSAVLVKVDDALCGISTGLDENRLDTQVFVYPSPVHSAGKIRVEGIDSNSFIEIYNLNGVLVHSTYATPGTDTALPTMVPGLYVVNISNETSNYQTKLIVQ